MFTRGHLDKVFLKPRPHLLSVEAVTPGTVSLSITGDAEISHGPQGFQGLGAGFPDSFCKPPAPHSRLHPKFIYFPLSQLLYPKYAANGTESGVTLRVQQSLLTYWPSA